MKTLKNDYEPMADTDRMPWGKHKGKQMQNVPASYLLWAVDGIDWIDEWPRIVAYVDENFDLLCQEEKKERLIRKPNEEG